MSKFRIGDYARSKSPPERIHKVDDQREADAFSAHSDEWERVTVRFAKPRRTLTLSQAFAWLHLKGSSYSLSAYVEGGWLFEGPKDSWHGATPIKAIIAARKALGVKS